MKKVVISLVIVLLVVLIVGINKFLQNSHQKPLAGEKKFDTLQKSNTPMKIVSPLIKDGDSIPSKFTCRGENVNPPLQFVDIPHEAQSLVLIMDDPDAPGGIWTHWVIFDMARTETFIDINSKPKTGIEAVNSFGKQGYGGPCPPSGTHRYFFKLYALDTEINLDANVDVKQVEAAMQGHILQQAELMGTVSQ